MNKERIEKVLYSHSAKFMTHSFFTCILVFTVSITFGQGANSIPDKEHPIEQKFADCLEKEEGQTTVGMMECAGKARDEWDKELNKYYKLLMDILSAPEKEKLRIVQRKWIEYRDNEYTFSGEMYYNLQGTMWRIAAVERQVELVKERALKLQSYYETLKENK